MSSNLRTILLVEDNPDHVFLARKAIREETGDQVQVFHVGDGETALEFLKRSGRYTAAPRPDLILLDLQLPGRDGFWVVQTIKSDPALKTIPIVIFTSSDAASDIMRGYECGTNIYVCKPTGTNEFAERIRAIPVFWNRVAHLPPGEDKLAEREIQDVNATLASG